MDLVSFSTLLPDKEAPDECDISLSEETKRFVNILNTLFACISYRMSTVADTNIRTLKPTDERELNSKSTERFSSHSRYTKANESNNHSGQSQTIQTIQ